MDIVRLSIDRPVGVAVGVILVVMFGLIGFNAIPIQLTPAIDRPIVTVTTSWPGRSPEEVVDEITREQEERLKNVANLKAMRSVSREGTAEITLEFTVGADISRALQEVSDSLRQVPEYPEDVTEPTIKAAEGASENAIAWMIIDVAPEDKERLADFDITTLQDDLEDEVKPFLERIEGVAEINVFGGRSREVRVLIDAAALAQRGLGHDDVVIALRAENRNVSAGSIAEGKRDYRIRLLGKLTTKEEVAETVVAYRDGKPVRIGDVAQIEIDHAKQRGFVRSFGAPCIAMNCIRQADANVMVLMAELRARLEDVKSEILPNLSPIAGDSLRLTQVYDETVYIDSAVGLVTSNLWVGGGLAALVLLIFMRSFVSTGVIVLAIPISVIGTFLAMLALGRSLNVISLAGLAFAVGMVVDNAIVVLENIYRHLQQGKSPLEAAYRGGKEVWGAVLASTLTTVAVFVPVLTIQEEAGQLFRDIALAIVCAVTLSLVVSITVIPAACSRWLSTYESKKHSRLARAWHGLFGLDFLASKCVDGLGNAIAWLSVGLQGATLRPLIIVAMTAASLIASAKLAPPLDYLPAGNRNLVFGGLLIPPGYSIEQQARIAERLETQVLPYAQADMSDPASMSALAPIFRYEAPTTPFPPIGVENFFIGAFNGGMFVGATSQDSEVVIPVGTLLTNTMNTVPDAFGGARQTSIFGRGVGGGNQINLEISGPRLDRVISAAAMMNGTAAGIFGYGNVRPNPANFNLSQPEWRLRLSESGRKLGLTTQDLAVAVRSYFDGAFAGEYQLGSDNIDIVVLPSGGRMAIKEDLRDAPIVTRSGAVVPFDTVVDFVPGLAPQEIQRIEELPSVTVQIVPPTGSALEQVMREVESKVIAPARAAGLIDRTMRIRLEGTAAQLDEVKAALLGRPAEEVDSNWRRGGRIAALVVLGCGILVASLIALRAIARRKLALLYGVAGALLLAACIGEVFFALGERPQLATARFVWALVVTYLLMCALFESFIYPFVIMFSVPLAIVGGFAGLRLVHNASLADPNIAAQQLDVLTMLGFVILIGVVVNNAILIVHQALGFMKGEAEGDTPMYPIAAIVASVKSRTRPIMMTSLTSVGGMLPLVLTPGAGSEMYRGLGSVVVGGLTFSTIFTMVVVPLLFGLVMEMRTRFAEAWQRA